MFLVGEELNNAKVGWPILHIFHAWKDQMDASFEMAEKVGPISHSRVMLLYSHLLQLAYAASCRSITSSVT